MGKEDSLELQKFILRKYFETEASDEQLVDYIRLWYPLVEKDFIDSALSAVIGTLFGKASLYFRFINYNNEITDAQIDMFNELFTEIVNNRREYISNELGRVD